MARLVRGARITGAAREALVAELSRRYAAGESIRSMAADLGRSYGFVQGLLKDAGVGLRTRGGATRGAEAEAARRATLETVDALRAELAAAAPEVPDVEQVPPARDVVVPVAPRGKAPAKDAPGKKQKSDKKKHQADGSGKKHKKHTSDRHALDAPGKKHKKDSGTKDAGKKDAGKKDKKKAKKKGKH